MPKAIRGLGRQAPGKNQILLAIATDAIFRHPEILPPIQDRRCGES
jgi:hypothetical protein